MQRTNGGANGSEVVTPTSTMRRRSPNSPLVLGFVVGLALCLGIGAYVLTSPYSGIVNGATSKIKTNEELARIAKNFVTALYGCDFSDMSSEEILEYGPVAERCLPYIKPGPESYNNFVSMVSETFKTSKPGTVRVIKGSPTVVATDERTYRVVVPYEIVEVKDETKDVTKGEAKDEGEDSAGKKDAEKETLVPGEVSQNEPTGPTEETDDDGVQNAIPTDDDPRDATDEPAEKKDTGQEGDGANADEGDENKGQEEDNEIKHEDAKPDPDTTSEGHGETESETAEEGVESSAKPKASSATNEAVEEEVAEDSATDEDVEDEVAEDTWDVSVDEDNNVAAAKVGANGGDYTTGDETTGGDTTDGDETTGDYTTDDDTTGGDETSGGETTGDYTTGDETASGDYTPSDDTSSYEVAPSYDVTTSYDEGSTETYGDVSGGAGDPGVASGESGVGAEV